MSLFRKYQELKSKRYAQLQAAEKALEAGDQAAYDKALEKAKSFVPEIEKYEALLAEKSRFGASGSPTPENIPAPGSQNPSAEDVSKAKQLSDIRSCNEYTRAWLKAVKMGARPATHHDGLEILHKAMTVAGGDPAGEDGGFLVPESFELSVQRLSKDFVDLSQFAHVENVSTLKGWRNIELTAGRSPLRGMEEDAPIPLGETPKVRRIEYNCHTYGDRIAISGALMSNAQGLMDYLSEWFAGKYVATKNGLILSLLNKLPFAAISGDDDYAKIAAVKRLLNRGLNTAHSRKAIFLTNANGYDAMDNWADKDGRAFFKPDISGDFDRIKGRRVAYTDVDLIPDIEESEVSYAPLYVGNLAAFAGLFVRNGMTMHTTNVGGEAWEKGGWEARVMCTMDIQEMDPSAVLKRGISV